MQYVGQTGQSLKNNGHSPSKIIIQQLKNKYDPNSSSRLKNTKRIKLNINGLSLGKTPFL